MLRVGLTGGIGSGKSTVAEIFSELGITVIDADRIAHQLTQSGTECFNEIIRLFGKEYIAESGELNRKKIAESVFSDPAKKIALENILHPKIKQRMIQEAKKVKHSSYIIFSVPLLFESNFTDLIDKSVVIDADDAVRIERIKRRDGRTEEQIRQIMKHQIDRNTRLQQADDILHNNGDIDSLRDSVIDLHQKYLKITA